MVGLGRYLTNYDTIIHGFTEHRGGEHHIFKEQLASSTAGCKMGRPGLQRCWKSSCGGGGAHLGSVLLKNRSKGRWVSESGNCYCGFLLPCVQPQNEPKMGGGNRRNADEIYLMDQQLQVRDPPLPSIPLTLRMFPLR